MHRQFEMKQLLTFVAVIEAATGLALIIAPSLVGRLLLGAESTGVAIPVARVLGIALIGLGVTCWPGPPLIGHVNLQRGLSRCIFLYLAIGGEWVGPLLWPAVVLHAVLMLLLAQAWFKR